MVFMLILGCGLGWVVHHARVQRDAVAAIERAGGRVMYEWQFKNSIPNPAGKPWAPKWLVDLVGVDYFGNAVYVISCTRKTSDAILDPVGRLSRLERLDLSDSAVTDAGLVHLEGLSRLRTLELGGTDISDAGIAHLKGLTNLRELFLQPSRVGDAGLAHLENLTGLRELFLGGTLVTDTGLPHLRSLTGLQALTLWGTRVSDVGLVHLEGLSSLEVLTVGGDRTQITEAGVKRLQRALPKVEIER
jgi:internalin A